MSSELWSTPSASYGGGEWVAIAAPDLWILVDARPDEELVADLWNAAREGDAHDALLPVVPQLEELHDRRGYGLVRKTEEGLILRVAGAVEAELTIGEDRLNASCPKHAEYADFRFPTCPSELWVGAGPESRTLRLPLALGVAPAGHLLLEWTTSGSEHGEATGHLSMQPTGKAQGTEGVGFADAAVEERPGHATIDRPLEGDQPSSPVPKQEESAYDFLFGHTVSRSVEDAAVHPHLDDDQTAVVEQTEHALPGSDVHEAAVPPRAAETPPPVSANRPIVRADASGMIESVPWVSERGGTSGEKTSGDRASQPPDDLSQVELTVSRSARERLARQIEEAAPKAGRPPVHAVRCPADHPNPAHAERCRICGVAIEDQSPVTVPRPVLGLLRFSTGDVISLDRGVLIGRKPSSTRLVGKERPHVVKLASPEHDISRNHLEISLDDWHVLVTDLGSTNGTLITRPGRAPERLRPAQAVIIEPGTTVSLSDDVYFTFETTA